jgi:hypothetical protein
MKMKRKQLIALIVSVVSIFSGLKPVAQNLEQKSLSGKYDSVATGSINKSKNQLWLGFDAKPQYQNVIQKPLSGPHFPPNAVVAGGFYLYYQLAHTVGFETGLQYIFADIKRNFTGGDISTVYLWRFEDKFHSLMMPALINLHTNGHRTRFYAALGFAGGMNLIARHYGNTKGFTGGNLVYDSTNIQWVKTNTGLVAAFIARAGVELNVSETMMVKIGADFNIGSTFSLGSPYYNDIPVLSEVYPYPVNPYSIGLNVAVLFRTKAPKEKTRN